MPIGESFRVEKEKKFVHAIAFKVDDEGLFKLDSCFETMKVKGKRRSDKMRDFINRVHILVDEHEKVSKQNIEHSIQLRNYERVLRKNEELKGEVSKLKSQVFKLTKEKDAMMKALSKIEEKGPIAKPPKPYTGPTHIKPPTPTKVTEKPSVVYDPKEHAKLDAQVTEKKEWVCVRDLPRHANPEMQKARCETCRVRHWSEWKACQELRREA